VEDDLREKEKELTLIDKEIRQVINEREGGGLPEDNTMIIVDEEK